MRLRQGLSRDKEGVRGISRGLYLTISRYEHLSCSNLENMKLESSKPEPGLTRMGVWMKAWMET